MRCEGRIATPAAWTKFEEIPACAKSALPAHGGGTPSSGFVPCGWWMEGALAARAVWPPDGRPSESSLCLRAEKIAKRPEGDAQQDQRNDLQFESLKQKKRQHHPGQRGHIEMPETHPC